MSVYKTQSPRLFSHFTAKGIHPLYVDLHRRILERKLAVERAQCLLELFDLVCEFLLVHIDDEVGWLGAVVHDRDASEDCHTLLLRVDASGLDLVTNLHKRLRKKRGHVALPDQP